MFLPCCFVVSSLNSDLISSAYEFPCPTSCCWWCSSGPWTSSICLVRFLQSCGFVICEPLLPSADVCRHSIFHSLWYTSHNSHLLLTEKNTYTEISSSLLSSTLLPMKSSRIILSEMKNTLQMNTHRNRQIGFHFQFIDYSHFWSDRWHWEEASAEHVCRDGNEVEAASTWFWIFRNVFSYCDAVCFATTVNSARIAIISSDEANLHAQIHRHSLRCEQLKPFSCSPC